MDFKILHCQNCGATSAVDSKLQPLCPWCHAAITNQNSEMPKNVEQAELELPIIKSEEDFEKKIKSYLAAQANTPDEIYDLLDESPPFLALLPLYKFDISYQATWNAAAGYPRKKPVYNNESQRYEDKEEINWEPIHGENSGTTTLFAPGATELESLLPEDKIIEICEQLPLENAKKFIITDSGVNNIMLFDENAEDAFRRYSYNEMQNIIENKCKQQLPERKTRDFQFSTTHKYNVDRILVPFYIKQFYWQGKDYSLFMDAVMGSADGEIPTSGKRQLKALLLGILPLFSLIAGAIIANPSTTKPLFLVGMIPLFAAIAFPMLYRILLGAKRKKLFDLKPEERIVKLEELKKFDKTLFYSLLSIVLIIGVGYIIFAKI